MEDGTIEVVRFLRERIADLNGVDLVSMVQIAAEWDKGEREGRLAPEKREILDELFQLRAKLALSMSRVMLALLEIDPPSDLVAPSLEELGVDTQSVEAVLRERARQVEAGRTVAHDVSKYEGTMDLLFAGICYLLPPYYRNMVPREHNGERFVAPALYPWGNTFKASGSSWPQNERADLVKGIALIIAHMDMLQVTADNGNKHEDR